MRGGLLRGEFNAPLPSIGEQGDGEEDLIKIRSVCDRETVCVHNATSRG